MTRRESRIAPAGVDVTAIARGYMTDPRDTGMVIGKPVVVGETSTPDVAYPGWQLTPFSFSGEEDLDGCIFSLAPGTATPIGLVGDPPAQDGEPPKNPAFTEFAIRGAGDLLIATKPNVIYKATLTPRIPKAFSYGPGTRVAYIAGPEGFVGINIGSPRGIPEDSLPHNDQRAPKEMWEIYSRLAGRQRPTRTP